MVVLVAEYLSGQRNNLLKQHTNIPLIYQICMDEATATPLARLRTEIPVMSAAYSFTLN